MPFEFPQLSSRERVDLLWTDLWRTVEQLQLMEKRLQQAELRLSKIAAVTGSPATTGRGSGGNGLHKLPFGTVTETVSGAKSAIVDGITALEDGAAAYIINDGTASASGWTLNVNGLGGKPVYSSTSGARITTTFAANAGYTFVYNASRDGGNGGWDMYYGYDSNTNTLAYNVRTQQTCRPLTDRLSRYLFLFTGRDGKLVPSYTVASGNGSTDTSKNLNTSRAFDPRLPIFYYGTTTNVAAGGQAGGSTLYRQYYACDMRYAWNTGTTTLVPAKPCYVRCTPNADGTVQLDGNNCLVQDLPATADGKVYIYLGMAYGGTNNKTYTMELDPEHPCYQYKDGAVVPWG